MSAYFSNLLTATKTRYQTLRAGEDVDGDTEDDSHISRVLRSYYTETGRGFPDWLGPPPRTHSPAVSSLSSASSSLRRPGRQDASLSDIWDAPAKKATAPAPATSIFPDDGGRPGIGGRQSSGGRQSNGGRQSSGGSAPGGVTTAQQRIKERLWGGRSNSGSSQHHQQQQQQHHAGPVTMPQEQVYMGSGMPWDDGTGGAYQQPVAPAAGGGNLRRGGRGPGLPSGPKGGYHR